MRKAFRKSVTGLDVGRPLPRLKNAGVGGGLQSVKWEEYDCYQCKTGTLLTKQVLFSIPFGQTYTPAGGTPITKSLWHTSLTANGQLVNPERLLVYAVALGIVNPITANDLNNFLGLTLISWTISGKPYLQLQASRIPSGGGPFTSGGVATTATTTSLNTTAANSGVPRADNLYTFGSALAQWIGQSQPFNVTLDPTLATTTNVAAGYTTDAPAATPPGAGVAAFFYLGGYKVRLVS
jgi:hypothetical protein